MTSISSKACGALAPKLIDLIYAYAIVRARLLYLSTLVYVDGACLTRETRRAKASRVEAHATVEAVRVREALEL